MDKEIQALDHRTDEATKFVLQSVVKRKRKFDTLTKKEKKLQGLLLLLAVGIMGYTWFSLQTLEQLTFQSVLTHMLERSIYFMFILVMGSLFFYLKYVHEKCEKAEKEFHELRCEIIQKAGEYWPQPTRWEARQAVFAMMMKKFDVNLYHEHK
ncbi:DUF2663 family protein [Priestia filamentosa]|uniref:DUF2663 family protein n=1 Tax=Priestia filamentosa TaxID=1402861 RepID=UPI001FB20FE8|nr:DUF2663 family protein [Priestia filamentosa]MED3725163.1 DUF2663 family protein [Priestia filamentosa]UOE61578.1 DUF2663 family protein [Priestia filamentosa]